mmetsp:Transcript_23827/g.80366  ORF Transcript_23827/g.80366 Transcript_23827/m.80366 type:complete len:295 (+) Transcript_23827:1114-1998(+)
MPRCLGSVSEAARSLESACSSSKSAGEAKSEELAPKEPGWNERALEAAAALATDSSSSSSRRGASTSISDSNSKPIEATESERMSRPMQTDEARLSSKPSSKRPEQMTARIRVVAPDLTKSSSAACSSSSSPRMSKSLIMLFWFALISPRCSSVMQLLRRLAASVPHRWFEAASSCFGGCGLSKKPSSASARKLGDGDRPSWSEFRLELSWSSPAPAAFASSTATRPPHVCALCRSIVPRDGPCRPRFVSERWPYEEGVPTGGVWLRSPMDAAAAASPTAELPQSPGASSESDP